MAHTGEVVLWNEDRGIGFISCRDFDKDVYVHHTGFGGGSLIVGDDVHFDIVEENGKKRAINVSGDAVERNGERKRRRRSRSRSLDRQRRMYVVKLREIENDLTRDDIADFFDDNRVDIEERKTLLDWKTETAYVVLCHQKDFDYVIDRMDGRKLPNGQRAHIFKSGDRDYHKVARILARKRGGGGGGGRRGRSRSYSSRGRSFSRSPSSRGRSRTPDTPRAKKSRRSRTPSPAPEKRRGRRDSRSLSDSRSRSRSN